MKIREKTVTSGEAFKTKNAFLYSSIEIRTKPTEFKVSQMQVKRKQNRTKNPQREQQQQEE